MDFIPGIDGPREGVPRVLACLSNNLLRGEPLKLVDGGEPQRTFVYIKDAIEAVLLMIENPARANTHIFNVGNPNNEVTVRQLAEMTIKVYSKVSGEQPPEKFTIDASSKEFYGEWSRYRVEEEAAPEAEVERMRRSKTKRSPVENSCTRFRSSFNQNLVVGIFVVVITFSVI
ncbi:unnamed protein product [Vicia faba]|uniref:NAD-dependent epimerase/dehydratase domain-containing protein n=1 Tax=Vicia faba TaxID=3906 RepID=A0AAV1B537_VICFA|nr:unnamed protein product [Vicia faba]